MASIGKPTLWPSYANDRLRISSTINQKAWSIRVRSQGVVNFVIEAENQDGSTFLSTIDSGDGYMIIAALGEIVHITRRSDALHSYLYQRYGLTEREQWTKFLSDSLRHHAQRIGDRAYVRRFAVWNQATKTSYLSRYDGTTWKIDGETITEIPNGEDRVFFLDDDGGKPCDVDIGPHGLFLPALTDLNFADTPGGVSHEQQKMALIVWIFAVAFPDLMPTKPYLLLEGAPGSGKSTGIKLLQVALMGLKKPISIQRNREDDFGLILLRSPLALFDNLDSFIEWLPDHLCAYATTGIWPRRKLYTDDGEVTIRPHAFVAVASKNPASFRREDTADRCIVLRLERLKEFVREEQMEARILEQRPKLLGEYLYYVNQIVKTIRAGIFEMTTETHRMADFAFFARVVGRVLGWEDEAIAGMITALQDERDAFIMEEDSLVEILHKWIAYKPHNGPSNVGREVGIHMLFQELESVAQAIGLPYYKTPRLLVQKIRSPHLERDFVVQHFMMNGQKAFRIWRRTDPQLRSVPAPGDTKSKSKP